MKEVKALIYLKLFYLQVSYFQLSKVYQKESVYKMFDNEDISKRYY